MTKLVRDNLDKMSLNPTQLAEINKAGGMDRELCSVDGCYKLRMVKGKKTDGTPRYSSVCSRHNNEMSHYKENHRKVIAKLDVITCSDCGVELDRVDVEVHHVDGNHFNNNPENLKKLCSICHDVYTINEKHYASYEVRFGCSRAEMKARMKASGHYYGRGK